MSDELNHECGIAALYWLDEPQGPSGPAETAVVDGDVAPLMPGMLLDLQNRGQLAAGMSSYNKSRVQRLATCKGVGTVTEAFRMSRPAKFAQMLSECAGDACIGHVRYATCGADDERFAQPFERYHGRLWKWFCFAFNGNLANYGSLRDRILARQDYHFALNADTEVIMHSLAYRLRGDRAARLSSVMASLAKDLDGAYNIAFLDGMGRMVIARDPLGFRPLSWAVQGRLFAAASESVALTNMGFDNVRSVEPGQMLVVENGKLKVERFAKPRSKALCFFEWVYFSNVASEIDGRSVYLARSRSGEILAEMEDCQMDDSCIVVPVPDTAKAAADAYAYRMHVPCVEGLIRNRYVGRTFIQPSQSRMRSVRGKYTPLASVLENKRVFLVEDSIVRSTTLKALVGRIRQQGKAREIHVRVACPPIVAPCFYGIDMSTLGELFAPPFLPNRYQGRPSADTLAQMAKSLGVESLRYLTVPDLADCLKMPGSDLCTGCVMSKYPTFWGDKMMRCARANSNSGRQGRTCEQNARPQGAAK